MSSPLDAHLTHATIAQAPKLEPEPVDHRPVIDEKTREDTLRRLKYPCLITESYDKDGNRLREYRHDPGVQRDVLISTVSTDRGEGSTESIDMLRKEDGRVEVDELLPREAKYDGPTRDASGRFTSKGK